jgi:hypothetical protein
MRVFKITVIIFSITACSLNTEPLASATIVVHKETPTTTPKPPATNTQASTLTATVIPTKTSTKTITATSTSTPTPQVLGRIFPEGFTSPGVWSNRNTGRGILEMNFDIHFDICLPYNFAAGEDEVLSPISGEIVNIYAPGGDASEGYGITIVPDNPIQGIEDLAKSIGYEMKNVESVKIGMGHINPLVELGQIQKGQVLGTPTHLAPTGITTNVVALVVIVQLDGKEYHFSPCEIPNETSFCGKCCPGTPYNCP